MKINQNKACIVSGGGIYYPHDQVTAREIKANKAHNECLSWLWHLDHAQARYGLTLFIDHGNNLKPWGVRLKRISEKGVTEHHNNIWKGGVNTEREPRPSLAERLDSQGYRVDRMTPTPQVELTLINCGADTLAEAEIELSFQGEFSARTQLTKAVRKSK